MVHFCWRDCRNDYIAEIQVVYDDSDDLPTGQGWELVEKTVSGKNANLNQVRMHVDSSRLYAIFYDDHRKVADLTRVPKVGAAVCRPEQSRSVIPNTKRGWRIQ